MCGAKGITKVIYKKRSLVILDQNIDSIYLVKDKFNAKEFSPLISSITLKLTQFEQWVLLRPIFRSTDTGFEAYSLLVK